MRFKDLEKAAGRYKGTPVRLPLAYIENAREYEHETRFVVRATDTHMFGKGAGNDFDFLVTYPGRTDVTSGDHGDIYGWVTGWGELINRYGQTQSVPAIEAKYLVMH
ncbi:hypothetical protein [Streptomyces sp. NPDC050287]|uniref:hypothetical protein n=1 Tax=Streptomyces sp. NPDC050287 TaxID=3365608 RepID=UPI0037A47352